MQSSIVGTELVVAAGILQGTFMLPTKFTSRWKWENMWLSYSVFAYLLFPWMIAIATVPHLWQILGETSGRSWAMIIFYGIGWGIGALTFGLGIDAVGLALGFAIILGITASVGALMPLLVLSSPVHAHSQHLLIFSGIAVMLIGIIVCARAGRMKETALGGGSSPAGAKKSSYSWGLVLCILSGVLSSFGNLGFAFGTGMTTVALRWHTPPQFASIPFWAVIIAPLFVCNAGYCMYLLARNRTFSYFRAPATGRYHLLTASMAVMWLIGMLIYGVGATLLGSLGPTIGWALLMSLVVVVANVWGIVTGEWKQAGRRPLQIMSAGLAIVVVSMFMVGLGNR